MKLNPALSILLAAAFGFANDFVLILLWGLIATSVLQSGFIEWYHGAHFLVSYSAFNLVSGLLLNILFCIPIAFIALKLFHRQLWLHVAVIAVAPRLADGFQIAYLPDFSAQMLFVWAGSLLMAPVSVAILRFATREKPSA